MCFGLAWFEQILIWIVIVCAIIGLLRLLVAFLLPKLGASAEVVNFLIAAVRIIIWAVVCIFAIFFIFELIACLLTISGGLSLPRVR